MGYTVLPFSPCRPHTHYQQPASRHLFSPGLVESGALSLWTRCSLCCAGGYLCQSCQPDRGGQDDCYATILLEQRPDGLLAESRRSAVLDEGGEGTTGSEELPDSLTRSVCCLVVASVFSSRSLPAILPRRLPANLTFDPAIMARFPECSLRLVYISIACVVVSL